jgi:hypothetical protein
MKLAIMQPYFFPYLGYFDLLYNVDLFIIYDNVQFIKQGWITRNRILHPSKSGWQYITIPVSRSSFHSSFQTPILDVEVADTKPWRPHILGQLAHYEKNAPHAAQTTAFVGECLATNDRAVSRLDVNILRQCASLIDIDFNYQYCSELALELDTKRKAEDRLLDLCDFLGATEYVNLPGGRDLYDPENFRRRNIKLTFRNLPTLIYETGPYAFEANLSIIDLLMWNRPQAIKEYLDKHRDAE